MVSAALAGATDGLLAWLKDQALPLWWEVGADHVRGGFHELLGQDGRPVEAPRRARVLARQVYVYAQAGRLGWDGPWREAVAHGLEFLLGRYRRPDGLFRYSVHPDGTPADDATWAYDQAFVLFALASAHAVLPERQDLAEIARGLAGRLERLRLPHGGFLEASPSLPYQSNPHMHLLEACLAWEGVDPTPVWGHLAEEMIGLCLAKFIDGQGQLHEFFAGDWSFKPDLDGRIVEPGHQFEWAWLLERWARLRGDDLAHQAALRLFDVGQGGVDLDRDVCHQQLLDDGTVHDPVGRLWPQTERIKAALIFDEEAEALRGIGGLRLYLATPTPGLWWDKCKPDGSFVDEPAPASSFYHIVCAIAELAAAR